MKSRKKFIPAFLVLTALGGCLGAVYLHFGIFPGNSRAWALEKISAATHKKINFSKAVYLPFRGFMFYDVEVKDANEKHLFSAQRFSINPRILPFFMEKKIIIDHVSLESPVVDVVLSPKTSSADPEPAPKTQISGQIDVPVAGARKEIDLESLGGGPDVLFPENVYLEQVRIVDGSMTVRMTENAPVLESIRSIHLRMTFQKPPILEIHGSLHLGEEDYGSISLSGEWDLKKASYRFFVTAGLKKVPAWLLAYQQGYFLIWREGQMTLKADLRSAGEEKALFHAAVNLQNSDIQIRQATYRGQMNVDAKGVFNFSTRFFERYRGTLQLKNVTVFNLSKKFNELHGVRGSVQFEPDLFRIESMGGHYENIPFQAQGEIRSFNKLHLDVEINTQTNMESLLRMIPSEEKKLLKNFNLSGECDTVTRVRGSLKETDVLSAQHKLFLKNGLLQSRDKKIIASEISGEILSDADGIRISKGQFAAGGKKYFTSLFFPKNRAESGSIHLVCQSMDLKSGYRILPDRIDLTDAYLTMPGLSARFNGFAEPLTNPIAHLSGDLEADLSLLRRDNASSSPWLDNLKPSGNLRGMFTLAAPWNRWLDGRMNFSGSASPLVLGNIASFEKVEIESKLSDRVLTVPFLRANAYDGTVGGRFSVDLARPQWPFSSKLYISHASLESLAKQMFPAHKKLAGDLIFNTTLSGLLMSQSSYTGEGSLSIKRGHLFETTQFRAMGELPLLKVEGLDKVTFRDLSTSFQIRNKRFWTQDLLLLSDAVNLRMRGSMGFASDLDLSMNIEYSRNVLDGVLDVGGLAPIVVQQAENLISEYHVGGTLKNPSYRKSILGTARNTGKKLTGLLQNLV